MNYKEMSEEKLTELRNCYEKVIDDNATNKKLIDDFKIRVEKISKELNKRVDTLENCKHLTSRAVYKNRKLQGYKCIACGQFRDKFEVFPHLKNKK